MDWLDEILIAEAMDGPSPGTVIGGDRWTAPLLDGLPCPPRRFPDRPVLPVPVLRVAHWPGKGARCDALSAWPGGWRGDVTDGPMALCLSPPSPGAAPTTPASHRITDVAVTLGRLPDVIWAGSPSGLPSRYGRVHPEAHRLFVDTGRRELFGRLRCRAEALRATRISMLDALQGRVGRGGAAIAALSFGQGGAAWLSVAPLACLTPRCQAEAWPSMARGRPIADGAPLALRIPRFGGEAALLRLTGHSRGRISPRVRDLRGGAVDALHAGWTLDLTLSRDPWAAPIDLTLQGPELSVETIALRLTDRARPTDAGDPLDDPLCLYTAAGEPQLAARR